VQAEPGTGLALFQIANEAGAMMETRINFLRTVGGHIVLSRLRVAIWQWGMLIGIVGYTLFACASGSTSAHRQDVFVTVTSQPVNVGDAKAAAVAYYNSGTYQKDIEAVGDQAVSWVNGRAASVKRPALVLDIDETALSNWEILKRDDFGRPIAGPCDEALDAPCG
jgi:hypothetical protein